MALDFRFRSIEGTRDAGKAMYILKRPRLWIATKRDYPDYDTWLAKVETQLRDGSKRGLICTDGTVPVATIIFQRHTTISGTVEVKNISVAPDARGRHIASFLVRNMEVEVVRSVFPDCKRFVLDTKASNVQMIAFLLAQHYNITDVTDLYDSGQPDTVLSKPSATLWT